MRPEQKALHDACDAARAAVTVNPQSVAMRRSYRKIRDALFAWYDAHNNEKEEPISFTALYDIVGHADTVIGILPDGSIKILKDRYGNIDAVSVQVKRRTVTQENYSTDGTQGSLNLASDAEVKRDTKLRLAVSPEDIRSLLVDAAVKGYPVCVSGVKADGTRYYARCITPLSVDDTYVRFEDRYVHKSFRLDGIKRAENAPA